MTMPSKYLISHKCDDPHNMWYEKTAAWFMVTFLVKFVFCVHQIFPFQNIENLVPAPTRL